MQIKGAAVDIRLLGDICDREQLEPFLFDQLD